MPQKSKILIVDDEPDLREAIAFDFESDEYQVFLAGSVVEALSVLERESIDIVLSDLRMPGGDGLELLEKVKAKDVFRPAVFLLTGNAEIELVEMFERGCEAVFSKPFDRNALLEAVRRCVQPMDARYRRKESRVTAAFPIGISFLKSQLSEQAKVVNLGRGGMFVALEGRLPGLLESCEFKLEFSGLARGKISGVGQVRWIRETSSKAGAEQQKGVGIEFLSFEKDCLLEIVEFINFSKTKSYIPRR